MTAKMLLVDEESDVEEKPMCRSPVNEKPIVADVHSAFAQISQPTSSALKGQTFLVTGQLTELSRDDATLFIRRHGGEVKTGVSSKLNFLVVGAEPGEAKLAKVKELRVQTLSEVELYTMVLKKLAQNPRAAAPVPTPAATTKVPAASNVDDSLWSDKYAPKKPADLCYPTLYNKIKQWLLSFEAGGEKKGMLVSGPPGIGKTTSVYVAAKELKYDVIELNTSNQRSGAVLHDQLDGTIRNQGLFKKKNLLLLDEVDGCDKGGVAEVIKLLKKTAIPIICTCNDHWDQKLKPLLAHVEDLRAQRAPYTAMSAYLEKVLQKEGIQIPAVYIQEMVMANGHDYRSLLNNIQLWSRSQTTGGVDASLQALGKTARKDLDINIFDTAKAFFDASARDAFDDRYNRLRSLYYSNDLIPMFIQENYLNYTPNTKTSQLLSTADVLQTRMYIDQQWQLSNAHFLHSSLYPHKLCRGKFQSFSATFNHYESGVKFPASLGKGSTMRKNYGIGQEILAQGALQTFDLSVFAMTIAPVILQRLFQPFQDTSEKEDSHRELIAFLQSYRLVRPDIDFINEIALINGKFDYPFSFDALPTAVKSKVTRECTAANLSERQKRGKAAAEADEEAIAKASAKKATATKRKATPTASKKPRTTKKKL